MQRAALTRKRPTALRAGDDPKGHFFQTSDRKPDVFPWMEGSKVIEVPVVCYLCRRIYRHAKIVPISPAPRHITGTCEDCKRVGSADYGGRGQRKNTLNTRAKSGSAHSYPSDRSQRKQ